MHRWLALPLALLLAGCPAREMNKAKALEDEGRLPEAADAYQRIARREPANLAAWDRAIELWCNRLVHVGNCMGVLDLELELLGTVNRHHEALSEVLELRARARLEQGLVEPALTDLERAEKAAPGRASVHVARAKAYVMVGQRAAAEDEIRRARELDSGNDEADEIIAELPALTATRAPAIDEGFGGGKR